MNSFEDKIKFCSVPETSDPDDQLKVQDISKETDSLLENHIIVDIHAETSNLGTNFNESYQSLPFPEYAETSLFCLKQKSVPRYQLLKLIVSPWFERATIFVIILNCITIGMFHPCGDYCQKSESKTCETLMKNWLDATDHFVFIYFTMEMLIKMVAMGIIGQRGYLNEGWNRLDCFIVISGYVSRNQVIFL